MGSRGRHRLGAPLPAAAGPTPRDPLFGTGIRMTDEWSRAEAVADLGFFRVARRLPSLVRLGAQLSWAADRRSLLAVSAAELALGATVGSGLLVANQALSTVLAGGGDAAAIRAAGPQLLVVAGAAALMALLRTLSQLGRDRLGPKVDRLAYGRLLAGAVAVELADIEDPDFQNQLSSARRGATAARQVVDGALGLLGAVLGLLAVTGVLSTLHPLLLGLLVLTAVPQGWATVRSARARYASMKTWIEVTRQVDVLASMLTEPAPASEIRAHGAGDFLLRHHTRLATASAAEQGRLAGIEARAALSGDALSGLGAAATYACLLALATSGIIPLAAAGTAVLALRAGAGSLRALTGQVNALYEHGLFVLDWQAACRECAERQMATGAMPVRKAPATVTARAVSFGYPGAAVPAVDKVDVTVRAGEVVALVGRNGSGKTTLAKLLTGLYRPDRGDVCWDGVPLDRLERSAVLDNVAMITQDFMQWPFTARVNVTIGRPELDDRSDLVAAAAAAGGAAEVVDGLPHGWGTLLAREFLGGTSLSGGQWQRIALARAWFRAAHLVVFDEPTAALDPHAEQQVFDRIAEVAGDGKAVLLITHRLASVRRASRIYVLENGRIVEHGTHEDLVRAGGGYAAMYRAQAERYL